MELVNTTREKLYTTLEDIKVGSYFLIGNEMIIYVKMDEVDKHNGIECYCLGDNELIYANSLKGGIHLDKDTIVIPININRIDYEEVEL